MRRFRKTTRSDKEKPMADCLQTATYYARARSTSENNSKGFERIVRQQDGFRKRGAAFASAQPQNCRRCDYMHESTVSRVTAIGTWQPAGIFELKYFFTSATRLLMARQFGRSRASSIRQLIDDERLDVLSDDTIVEKLRDAGTTLRAGQWPNIAKQCEYRPQCNGAAKSWQRTPELAHLDTLTFGTYLS